MSALQTILLFFLCLCITSCNISEETTSEVCSLSNDICYYTENFCSLRADSNKAEITIPDSVICNWTAQICTIVHQICNSNTSILLSQIEIKSLVGSLKYCDELLHQLYNQRQFQSPGQSQLTEEQIVSDFKQLKIIFNKWKEKINA